MFEAGPINKKMFGAVVVAAVCAVSADAVCPQNRLFYRYPGALAWLGEYDQNRAMVYLTRARRAIKQGSRQLKGEDKSNEDPYIKMWDAQNQILAALDLAGNSSEVWMHAGRVLSTLGMINPDNPLEFVHESEQIFAKACRLNSSHIEDVKEFVAPRGKNNKILTALRDRINNWNGKPPTPRLNFYEPIASIDCGVPETTTVRDARLASGENASSCQDGTCSANVILNDAIGGGGDAGGGSSAIESGDDDMAALDRLVKSGKSENIFPTYIWRANVLDSFGTDFTDKLANISVTKYHEFAKKMNAKSKEKKTLNDLNDMFFQYQSREENRQKDRGSSDWNEMFQSREWNLLYKFFEKIMFNYLDMYNVQITEKDKEESNVHMWVAVYPGEGGRHGHHVHQQSLVSCVFYAKTDEVTTPIIFSDPRGSPPIEDYEQHLSDDAYASQAPFHHGYNFFAGVGDVVCFPSWLVHNVPAHKAAEERVAFAANLMSPSFAAWSQTAVL